MTLDKVLMIVLGIISATVLFGLAKAAGYETGYKRGLNDGIQIQQELGQLKTTPRDSLCGVWTTPKSKKRKIL